MNFPNNAFSKITTIALFAITTTTGFQSTASANSRFDYLNQQTGIQTSSIQTEASQPQPTTPVSQQMQPTQATAKPPQEDEIAIKDIYPEYCRSYFFQGSGTVSLFQYFQGLERCKYGGH